MKPSLVFVGLLATTFAAAQVRTAAPTALAVPADAKTVSPLARVGNTAAIDPQFDLLRKQITLLKQQQAQQQDKIVRLQACVRALVKAIKSNSGARQSGGPLNSSSGAFAGPSSPGAPINGSPGMLKSTTAGKPMDDQQELNNRPGTLAPGPARANLADCN